jgi:acyl carrier protein
VKIEPRRGLFHNELTRFRYDVTFQLGGEPDDCPVVPAILWNELNGVGELWSRLRQNDCGLLVRDVPSTRLEREVQMLNVLSGPECPPTVGELRQRVDAVTRTGVEPEDLWRLADAASFDVHLTFASSGHLDRYDVLVLPRRGGEGRQIVGFAPRPDGMRAGHGQVLTNVPVGRGREDCWTDTLRKTLQVKLPDYMVPSSFVVLDRMPLTPNGKVNRRALPAPDRQRPPLAQTLVTPRTPIERVIANAWQDVLGIERVGMDDNFFDLGGHSLLLVQLHGKLAGALDAKTSVIDLFRYPTVGSFARFVATHGTAGDA